MAGLATDRVEVAWGSIEGLLAVTDYPDLLFRPGGGSAARPRTEAIAAAEAAAEYANSLMPEESTLGEQVAPSPYGPVLLLRYLGTEAENRAWCDAYAERLTRDGWAGVVEAFRHPQLVAPRLALQSAPKLAAFLAYRTEPAPPGPTGPWGPQRWSVDEQMTEEICGHMVDWGLMPGAVLHLRQATNTVAFDGPDPGEHLRWAAEHDYLTGLTYLTEHPARVRQAHLGGWGEVVYQIGAADPDWRVHLEDLRQVLIRHPDRLDLAMIRLSHIWVATWFDYERNPEPPHIDSRYVERARALLGEYVPDAHGMQVLTDAHLARATDLSNWDIQPLTPGRHLVQSRDPAAWYADHQPDPDILATARHDFGDMLLTPTHLHQ